MKNFRVTVLLLVSLIVIWLLLAFAPNPFPPTPNTTFDVIRWDGKEMTMQGNNCKRVGDWFTCGGESVKVISVKAR